MENYIDRLIVKVGDCLIHKLGMIGKCLEVSDNIVLVESIYNGNKMSDDVNNFLILKKEESKGKVNLD